MNIGTALLANIAGGSLTSSRQANIASVVLGLDRMGAQAGINLPHRLAHYLAQIAHESGRFIYDKEVWGPTAAQKRYDTRTDLGNTAAVDGDGKLFSGRGPIQITGRDNVTSFRDWCRAQALPAPDFVADPGLINTDPWEGLGPIWFWSTRRINRYADENNIEMVTRTINGGTNGFDDRVDLYVRAALAVLGRKLEAGAVKAFQAESSLVADDIAGPATRAALHKALVALKPDAIAIVAEPEITAPAAVPAPVDRPPEPAPPAPAGKPVDWQPALTTPEYLTIIETSTAALRKLTAGA